MDIFKLYGVLIILLFYGSYFTKLLLQRRQGISTDRLGRGDKPKRTAFIESFLKAATYGMAAAQIISLALPGQEYLLFHREPVRYAGLAISLAGILIFITAMSTMKNSWRAGVDTSQQTQLVRRGIYRFSRNPAFLGFHLFYLGFAITFSNLVLGILFLLCILLFHLQILEEEKFLSSILGEEYLTYQRSTGRYFFF